MEVFHHSSCPLCGSSHIELFINTIDHSISNDSFSIFQCKDCFFVFTQNAPVEEVIAPYYESSAYVSHSNEEKSLFNSIYQVVRNAMFRKKRRLIKKFSDNKVLLDIGCGTGHFLYYMKKNGYEVEGIEPAEKALTMAKEKLSLRVNTPNYFLEDKRKEAFGIITMWHVLEHIYNLDAYLKKIYQLLKTDGVLFIALPNHDSFDAQHYKYFWAPYDVPRHLWHFSPDTFKKIATKYGFKVIKMRSLPFDPFFNALLSERYKKKGWLAYPLALFWGSIAYFIGLFSVRKASSVIYILKKIR